MAMIAPGFLQHRRLAARREKRIHGLPPKHDFASRAPRHLRNSSLDYRGSDARIARKWICNERR
jgi:hypothetical protein